MSDRLDVKLDRDIDIQIYEYAIKVGREIFARNQDLNPAVRFLFDKKNPEKMNMLIQNEDASTFFSQLDYHINEKFIIQGPIDAKIYYLVLYQLGQEKNNVST